MGELMALNESPSEKEGKSVLVFGFNAKRYPLNESPSEKEGKSDAGVNEGCWDEGGFPQ